MRATGRTMADLRVETLNCSYSFSCRKLMEKILTTYSYNLTMTHCHVHGLYQQLAAREVLLPLRKSLYNNRTLIQIKS